MPKLCDADEGYESIFCFHEITQDSYILYFQYKKDLAIFHHDRKVWILWIPLIHASFKKKSEIRDIHLPLTHIIPVTKPL